ncbi:lamin tail domain-containing protein [Stackebrandtia nassauensis]
MRKKILATLAATLLAIGVSLAVTATPASAHEGGIHIGLVQFNSPGSDSGSNTSLNAEWINIHNARSTPYQIKGWYIKDNAGYKFLFPTYTIGAGKNVKVHTGKGSNGGGHVYWGRSWYVWNNTGDKARLYTPSGNFDDSCSWDDDDGSQKSCH